MYYKISINAQRETLEDYFGVKFKFPKIYLPMPIINGMDESLIPLITLQEKDKISSAIWGLLPEDYNDDWQEFQEYSNTLNIHKDLIATLPMFKDSFENRRGVVIVTGFFAHHFKDGSIELYYIRLASKKPFLLAAIYNKLDDGFITCSLIVTNATSYMKQIDNINFLMPLVIDLDKKKEWLNKETSKADIYKMLNHKTTANFVAYPISKKLYKSNIILE